MKKTVILFFIYTHIVACNHIHFFKIIKSAQLPWNALRTVTYSPDLFFRTIHVINSFPFQQQQMLYKFLQDIKTHSHQKQFHLSKNVSKALSFITQEYDKKNFYLQSQEQDFIDLLNYITCNEPLARALIIELTALCTTKQEMLNIFIIIKEHNLTGTKLYTTYVHCNTDMTKLYNYLKNLRRNF